MRRNFQEFSVVEFAAVDGGELRGGGGHKNDLAGVEQDFNEA